MVVAPAYRAMLTGIGCVSPFGVGGAALVAEMLTANVSAIRPVTHGAPTGRRSQLAAQVPAACLPETDESRRWSRVSYMTVLACRQALAEASLDSAVVPGPVGLVIGSHYGDLRSTEAFCQGFLRKGPLGLSPLLFPSTVMNAMAGMSSIALGLKGPMLTVNQSGVAGELAVARAVALLRAGRAQAVLACGVDEVLPLLYDTLAQMRVLSPRDAGEEACRPFDQRHNGPILGEGATAVLLETPAHARARGVPILAEVRGACWGGIPTRPGHVPHRTPRPPSVIAQALRDAAMRPEDIELAYVSGNGEPQHDARELDCLADIFGTPGPLLTSITHLTGDYGSLGTLRVAAAALTLRQGVCARLEYLDEPLRPTVRFTTAPLTKPPATVLVHGLAMGGTHIAIVLGGPSA